MKLLISFDIKDERPHNAVKIYDANGNALGSGEVVAQKIPEGGDLFEKKEGYVSYVVDFDLAKANELVQKKEVAKTKSKEEITSDTDVEDSGDPDEDAWVRKSLFDLRSAKAKITLTTVAELRESYRGMKKYREEHPQVAEPEPVVKTDVEIKDSVSTRAEETISEIVQSEGLKEPEVKPEVKTLDDTIEDLDEYFKRL